MAPSFSDAWSYATSAFTNPFRWSSTSSTDQATSSTAVHSIPTPATAPSASTSQSAPPAKAMARTKTAASGPILDGCKLALSGRFDEEGHSHASLTKIATALGASVSATVLASTTHVISSEDDYQRGSAKVRAADTRGQPVMSLDWLLDSLAANRKVDVGKYEWSVKLSATGSTSVAANGIPTITPNVATTSNGTTNGTSANGKKKRTIADAKDDSNDNADPDSDSAPAAKKTKGTKKGSKANGKAPAKNDSKDDAEGEDVKMDDVAEGQILKDKSFKIPLDEGCPLPTYQVYIDPDTSEIYDASLNQTNASHNNNKFYRLQVLVDSKQDFKTWSRWGRVGENGQSAILGDGTEADAVKQFKKKFRDKSGLPWEKRGDNPKPGKYAFVERSYNPDSEDEDGDADQKPAKGSKAKTEVKNEDEDVKPPPDCTLDKPVRDLMELIFNQTLFQATMAALNYDAKKLPLGKLSKTTISRGFQQLKDLAAIFDDSSVASSRFGMSAPAAIEQLSNTYYSVIPHAFGRHRPPIISDETMLKKEVELLESLSDMKAAEDIMKFDKKKTVETIHPMDRHYKGLGMEEMTVLDKKSNEFKHLAEYLNESKGSTHHFSYDIQDIFRIERQGEFQRFDGSKFGSLNTTDRRLLWHGSRTTNFGGILSQGLRIAPPEAPVSGYMFGKGIYLADMSSKSAQYCASYNSQGNALLLLCEAELGDPMQKLTNASYNAGETALKNGMVSTWGQGNTGPLKWKDAGVVNADLKGIKMPDTSSPIGATNVPGAGLFYNEYICYDVSQVKLRYLFRVKM